MARAALALAIVASATPTHGATKRIEAISVDPRGLLVQSYSMATPTICADGRFVAFASPSGRLLPGGIDSMFDILVRDRATGKTELVSRTPTSVGDANRFTPVISGTGRFVLFASGGDVSTGVPVTAGLMVHDRATGTTERVDVSSTGEPANLSPIPYALPALSADGRFVAFQSDATNLVPGDTNRLPDVFLRDRLTQRTEIVSVTDARAPGNGYSGAPALSADGRYVVFLSNSTNLIPGVSGGLFLWDRLTGTTDLIHLHRNVGEIGVFGAIGLRHGISADGRFVVFDRVATEEGADLFGAYRQHVYLRDRQAGTTERISISTGGAPDNQWCSSPDITPDGRFVIFNSRADNLVPGDVNNELDIFVRDRLRGTTERIGLTSGSVTGVNSNCWPAISADGRVVAFQSSIGEVLPGHGRGVWEVFVAERGEAPPSVQVAVFRPSTREWFLHGEGDRGSMLSFGGPGDQPVPANYLGDGRHAGVAVFRPTTAQWFLRGETGASLDPIRFGMSGDMPVSADYLGIGRAQIAVFRPGSQLWLIRSDAGSTLGPIQFGAPGDVPVPANYLADGRRTQIAVFRPTTGQWFLRDDRGITVGPIPFGKPGDVPVPADYLGIGRVQIAVFNPGTGEWRLRDDAGATTRFPFGGPGDIPVPIDYLGAGRAQIAVYRPSTGEWFVHLEEGRALRIVWGGPGDRPVAARFVLP